MPVNDLRNDVFLAAKLYQHVFEHPDLRRWQHSGFEAVGHIIAVTDDHMDNCAFDLQITFYHQKARARNLVAVLFKRC